jgi:hypothetical protein
MQVDLLWDERVGQWSSLAAVHTGHNGASQLQIMLKTCSILDEGGAAAEAAKVRDSVRQTSHIAGKSQGRK